MTGRRGAATMASAVFLALLILPAAAPLAQGAPVAAVGNGTGAPQQWAYGAQTWDNRTHVGPGAAYSVQAYFGWQVILTATNTSATTTQLEADRTVAMSLYAQYCAPDCKTPRAFGNLSIKAWQKQVEFVNVTSAAVVYENGTASPALGLSNGSANVSAKLTESYQIQRNSTVVRAGSLDVARQADAQVVFAPALGLIPWNAAANLSWNATSGFTAAGDGQDAYSYSQTVGGLTSSGHGQSTSSVSHQGNESARGADRGNVTLRNGMTVDGIVLAFRGPFDIDDGLFIAAHQANLFGGATQNWTVRALGGGFATTSRLDVTLDRFHHSGHVVAAEAAYSANDQSVGASGGASATGTVSSGTPAPSGTLQAQPEPVAFAQTTSACMVTGCGGSSPSSLRPSVAIALAVVVAVGIVAVAVALYVRPKRGTPVPAAPPAYTGPSRGPVSGESNAPH